MNIHTYNLKHLNLNIFNFEIVWKKLTFLETPKEQTPYHIFLNKILYFLCLTQQGTCSTPEIVFRMSILRHYMIHSYHEEKNEFQDVEQSLINVYTQWPLRGIKKRTILPICAA